MRLLSLLTIGRGVAQLGRDRNRNRQCRRPLLEDLEGRKLLSTLTPAIQGGHIGSPQPAILYPVFAQ